MGWDSAATIINDAALELGIGTAGTTQPAGADPWASKDQNVFKLISYLKSGGRDIVREREWLALKKEYTFVTNLGQESYDPPPDFRNVSTRTGWDRTTRYPLGGPLDDVEWQYLKGILAGNPLMLYFRSKGGKFLLAGGANVPGGRTVAFEYASRYFAGDNGAELPGGNTKEFPTAFDDVVFLDPHLMTRRLMHDFARKNGMGDVFKEEYETALHKAVSDDAQMPVLNLARAKRDNLIGPRNLPPTGWGT